jgi:hypothetical protein
MREKMRASLSGGDPTESETVASTPPSILLSAVP